MHEVELTHAEQKLEQEIQVFVDDARYVNAGHEFWQVSCPLTITPTYPLLQDEHPLLVQL